MGTVAKTMGAVVVIMVVELTGAVTDGVAADVVGRYGSGSHRSRHD